VRTKATSDFISLTQLVCNVTEAFTTTVFLPDETGKTLHLRFHYSLGNSIIEKAAIPLGHGLVGWVAKNNLPVNIAPFKRDSRTLQFYSASEDIQSLLAVPFEAGNSVGVLCIDSKKHYSFTSRHQKILTGFADQFSRLLNRTREMEKGLKIDHGTREMECLQQICEKIFFEQRKLNILERLTRLPTALLRYDGCAVSILSDDNKKFFILRSAGYDDLELNFLKVEKNASLVGLVLKKGAMLNYPQIKKKGRRIFIFQAHEPTLVVKSFLGVPLKCGNQVIGVWSFTGRQASMFSARHAKIISIIALMAASSLGRPKVSHDYPQSPSSALLKDIRKEESCSIPLIS